MPGWFRKPAALSEDRWVTALAERERPPNLISTSFLAVSVLTTVAVTGMPLRARVDRPLRPPSILARLVSG